jgi:hypothetical protein
MTAINKRGTWAAGRLTVPHNFTVQGSSDNGSGLVRILVDSTSGYSTGMVTDVVDQVGSFSCSGAGNNAWVVTVVDATHFDLQASTSSQNNVSISIASPAVVTRTAHGFAADQPVIFGSSGSLPTGITAGTTYFVLAVGLTANTFEISLTKGGSPINTSGSQSGQQILQCAGNGGSLPLNWAMPGGNFCFSGRWNPQGPCAQVTDMSQDATNTFVDTTISGGFPTQPGTNAAGWVSVSPHPAPKFTCTNCTGSADAIDLSNVGAAGRPIWSYSKRTITQGAPSVGFIPIFGQLTSLNITVNSASNAGGAMNANLSGGALVQLFGSTSVGTLWSDPTINAKIASGTPRVMTQTTTSGAQSGDTLTMPGANTWIVNNQIEPGFSSPPAGGDPVSVTYEFTLDQGVVYP